MAKLWPAFLSAVVNYVLLMYVANLVAPINKVYGASNPPKERQPRQTDCVARVNMKLILGTIMYLAMDVIYSQGILPPVLVYLMRGSMTIGSLWEGINVYGQVSPLVSAAGAAESSPYTVLWYPMLAAALALYLLFQLPNLVRGGQEHRNRYLVGFEIALFLVANLAAIALYFAAFYDPQATTKPGWADYLG